MTEYNIFCAAEKYDDENSFQQSRWRAFNKVVGEERYWEIVNLIKDDIFKDLKLELDKNSWQDEWKKVLPKLWSRMRDEIPEYDEKVVEMVIGFKPEYEEPDSVAMEAIKMLESKGYKIVKNDK
jgi:hypothetical protein